MLTLAVGGQHVIEAAVADVVAPAVAADDPHALLDQFVGHRQQIARRGRLRSPASFCFSAFTRSRCAKMPSSVV